MMERVRPWVVDAVVAAAIAVAGLWIIRGINPKLLGPRGVGGYELGLAWAVVPLVFRRRFPITVLLVVASEVLLARRFHVPTSNGSQLALTIACYSQAAYTARRVPWLGAAIATTVSYVIILPKHAGLGLPLIMLCQYGAAAVFGDMRWQSERIYRLLAGQALELERDAALLDRLATSEERARIARDTDRLLGGSLLEMGVQARAAREALPARPGWAAQQLSNLADTGRGALLELRRLLGVLRSEEAPPVPDAVQLRRMAPAPVASMLPRWLQNPWVQDLGTFAAFATFTVWDVAVHKEPSYTPHYGAPAMAMGVAIMATVLLRRRLPWVALGAVCVLGLLQTGPLNLRWSDAVSLVLSLLVFTVAARSSLWAAAGAAAAALASQAAFIDRLPPHVTEAVIVGIGGWLVFAVAVGQVVQRRTRANSALDERLDRLAAQSELRARIAVADERSRIARDMHDAVGHALSLMVVQAGGAAAVAVKDPSRAAEAIDAIEAAATRAESEMAQLLDVLGDGGDAAEARVPDRFNLELLVDEARVTGLSIDLVVRGEPALSDGVHLTTYRIVQEALTNARKHAPGAPVTVDVHYQRSGLEVRIANEATSTAAGGPALPGSRLGLHGMRERAAVLGGRVEAMSRADGGFEVRAYLPDEPVTA